MDEINNELPPDSVTRWHRENPESETAVPENFPDISEQKAALVQEMQNLYEQYPAEIKVLSDIAAVNTEGKNIPAGVFPILARFKSGTPRSAASDFLGQKSYAFAQVDGVIGMDPIELGMKAEEREAKIRLALNYVKLTIKTMRKTLEDIKLVLSEK